MTPSRWAIFAVIVVVIFGGLFFMSRAEKVDISKVDPNSVITEGQFKDHIYGKTDAKVTIIEYGDFQCPSCKGAFPGLKTIKEEFKDDIRFVFRHFPLTSIHPNALAASAAAQAAAEQGKFWEMHDLLYENQDTWSSAKAEKRAEAFQSYAEALKLDLAKYNAAVENDSVVDYISYQRQIGSKAGVNATPTIFVNGEKLDSNGDVYKNLLQGDGAKLKEKIQALLKK